MTQTWTKEQFFAELDALGEHEVRVRLATRIYSDVNERGGLAREWLLREEESRSAAARAELRASSLESNQIARSAKNWAAVAAIAAMIANVIAIVAIVVSIIALRSFPHSATEGACQSGKGPMCTPGITRRINLAVRGAGPTRVAS